MKLQRVIHPEGNKEGWIVIGDDFLPVDQIHSFLKYLRNLGRSPNTVRTYAYALKLYWEYLQSSHLDWDAVKVPDLANFMLWLRSPDPDGVVSMMEQEARRSESSVNVILTAVCMFYDFHEQNGDAPHIPLYRSKMMPGRRYKNFLHHITKGKPIKTRLLKLKVPKKAPKTITTEEVEQLVKACKRTRDKFLLCLLHESGMRIGQALGLRHEDIHSWDNVIKIIPRDDNINGARAKSMNSNSLDISKNLMSLYSEYLEKEFMEILDDNFSDYVFVNLWDGCIGKPMSYNNVLDLFNRLKRKTGISITPHMLRHTHATELIREGMEMAYVQKRLGHASIQTTIDTYVHVSNEDMKREYQHYLEQREINAAQSERLTTPTDC